jgi:two-component system sensor histidine kinase KdpD
MKAALPTRGLARHAAALFCSVAVVALVTSALVAFKTFAPVLSLGVLYVFAVLPIAIIFGLGWGLVVSVASMLAFNWFFLPPVHTFTLQDSENWFALAVYLFTAVIVSWLAATARRRARESALLAEIAASLLEHPEVHRELDRIGEEAARALQVESARIDLEGRVPAGEATYPLEAGGRRVGAIHLEGPRPGSAAARRHLLPALASMLGIAIDRERLAREALEAEALRRSDATKTAVLRAVSHDLRTPLMAILASASALVRPDLKLDSEDRAELAATILGEATRLDRLVGNLLDLSRLQAGAAQPEPTLWPMDDLVIQAVEEMGDAGERVEISLSDDSAAVQVDAHQVQRVLVNLIENALKYSTEPIRMQVSSTPTEVLVRVVDQGPGVGANELERIFEPFQRGSRGDGRGAGLGLAIARGFAEANHGRVWAESRPGQGATFVLAFPVQPTAVTA